MSGIELTNKGLISLHGTRGRARTQRPRTLIVSGVARSGTSMVARILHAAGVPMGEQLDDVVFEDHDFAVLFSQPILDQATLDMLVRRRDEAHRVWGFKRPHLHPLGTSLISRFRNPSLIITLRDPVAIAERNAIAEQLDQRTALSMAVDDLQEMVRFAQLLTCPVLLVSYEKALYDPERFVGQLLDFCGLPRSEAERRRLGQLVEPGRPAYIEAARRNFDGYIDGIDGTVLSGWAYQPLLLQPLTLTVFRDDIPVADCLADQHRQDLVDAGIDDGRHGFSINLAGFRFGPASQVMVRVKDRSFALNKSGATAAELGADLDALQRELSHDWAIAPFI